MRLSLKAIRIDRGFTQSEMAEALEVSRKTIASWENGESMPTVDKVDDICAFLGVSYENIRWKV